MQKSLQRANLQGNIQLMSSSQEVYDYLFAKPGRFPDQPFLILLDLDFPESYGYLLLDRIKTDERTKHIPIIVPTAAENRYAIARCYDLMTWAATPISPSQLSTSNFQRRF